MALFWSTILVFEGSSGCNQLKAQAVTAVRANSFPSNLILSGKNCKALALLK